MALMMASDASRRWLDDSGIWSCRIKLPQSQPEPSRQADSGAELSQQMAPTAAMDVTMQSTSPSSRRNKGKIVEALHSMGNLNSNLESLDLPTDPDAQTTVTDFLDFTEYLPADMMRSLTLVGNLDQTYTDNSASVHELTKKYGDLPTLPTDGKPDPVALRADISEHLSQAVIARTLSHAEASRMAENVDRHYNRAKNILAKLQAMADNYPASRETSPVPQKQKSPVVNRPPKIMLRVGTSSEPVLKVRKHRAPRITVPGEVLAPYELDYESYGSETDISSSEEEEEPLTPRATPGGTVPKIKLKVSKKDKAPKPPRGPRPPGVMGTNVHSQVAGISTSNALAKLKPPPPDAVKGDDHLPWLQLNAWELAHLRKRMKKNAIWSPSDTMIARELKQLGRGIEAYRAAKAEAEATGQPFDKPEPPQLRGETVHAEGAISVEALKLNEPQLSNRGMKLNEAKKLKKENQAKELAKQAAEEAEESARKMALAAKAMAGIFEHKKPPAKTPSKSAAKKRKRDSPPPEAEGEKTADGESTKSTRPPLKRNKTETPVPVPQPISTKQTSPILPPESAPSIASEAAPLVTPTEPSSEPLPIPAPLVSPKKSSTPILPPVKEPRKSVKKEVKKAEPPTPSAATSRPRRTSAAATPAPAPAPVIVPEPLPAKRPTSSRSKAASVEPNPTTATSDRPRRASTARNTPAPEPRQPSKRTKRPAPGVVTAGSEGSTTVSVGKRVSATRKKAGAKKEKKDGREGSAAQEAYDEIDDDGNIIDPDEPRYCICNRVSFGTMIGCENSECEKEWFHLECVGLTEVPARTTKWYCPQCRVTLRIGEKGEVNARGKKK
ncbi:uncharacterized protein LY89DRAFT_715261 [Mollisia scopiformis]|uniref:PHD-type domain-containing protein n=1 Tax=Mollisia scopiformis TaxID=149040 RepID=A0A194XLK0_MOLSC|nr:uncharacterized protein LY89DRAFT_715261 [Mollisia scopiformis]KUJ20959.1 hypothetical protein LY89DRAFT_715261 [Mollisia scopiformis]